jgi:hypothetical protein
MKKRVLMVFVAAVMAFAITGCTSVETSKNFNGLGMTASRSKPIAQINARVFGVFLFDAFPMFCGSVNNVDKVAAFVNTVSLENAMGLATRHARGLGATKMVNVNSYYYSHWLWYTIIMWERQMQVSGTAIK